MAGSLPVAAQYTDQVCVVELSPLSTNSFKLYGIAEWFNYRRKNGLSLKFWKYWKKYLALATYVTKTAMQIPVTAVACAEAWPYINEVLK